MLVFPIGKKKMYNKSEHHIFKRIFNETSRESFRVRLREIKWDNLKTSNDSNLAFNEFLDTFTSLYDDRFPRLKIKVKAQNSFKPSISKGIAKSSKKKQELYKKYLKNRNLQNLATYKTYKNVFETIKRKSKKNYYSEKILSFKGDAKNTSKTMTDLIGKAKMNKSLLPQKIRVKKN